VARLLHELLDEILLGEHAERDERLAELAAVARRAPHGLEVLLLGDDAARHEEVPERLVARRRRRAHRVAAHEVDALRDAGALQEQPAGDAIVVQIEEDRGQRPHRQLARTRGHPGRILL
jgi:hypothetical protein